MAAIYCISDTHFGHQNILSFVRKDGSPVRPFSSVEEMNETMVQRWNEVVRPQDHIYHLGDFCMHKRDISIAARLNGHKRLLPGNHDIHKTKEYYQYFEEIKGVRVFEKLDLILSHFPLHPESLRGNWTNVHGHVHNNVGPLHFGPRYFNVSVEVIDYRPITLEEVQKRVAAQKLEWDRLQEEKFNFG